LRNGMYFNKLEHANEKMNETNSTKKNKKKKTQRDMSVERFANNSRFFVSGETKNK